MMNHSLDLQIPSGLKWVPETLTPTFGELILEPLEKGYGATVGNSLRRVLLTSLRGAAITRVKIDGIAHEFSPIPGVKEDGTQLSTNIKGIVVKFTGEGTRRIRLYKTVAGPVIAGDITTDGDVEVLNADHYICTLDQGGTLAMEFEVETGRGYVPFTENRPEDLPIGIIPVDSIFAPVVKVKYTVENTRVNQRTDYEKLILEVTTNGSLSPQEAVSASARILLEHFGIFGGGIALPESVKSDASSSESRAQDEKKGMKIDELELGVRALNCLYSAGINSVGDLLSKTEDEIMKVPHLGKKSLSEIKEKLANLGLSLKAGE